MYRIGLWIIKVYLNLVCVWLLCFIGKENSKIYKKNIGRYWKGNDCVIRSWGGIEKCNW